MKLRILSELLVISKMTPLSEARGGALKGLIEKFCDAHGLHSFEGSRGIRNLTKLVGALGYRDLDYFFEDNSGSFEAMVEWLGDHEHLWDDHLDGTIEEYLLANDIYSFEGPRGVKNFTRLVGALGYRDLDYFFEDNSGAIETIIEWIGKQRNPDWEAGLKEQVTESMSPDDAVAKKIFDKIKGTPNLKVSHVEQAVKRYLPMVGKNPKDTKLVLADVVTLLQDAGLMESVDALEAWKEKVRAAYPNEKFKFRGTEDGNVEAVVNGKDRSYGVFDVETEKGEVFGD